MKRTLGEDLELVLIGVLWGWFVLVAVAALACLAAAPAGANSVQIEWRVAWTTKPPGPT